MKRSLSASFVSNSPVNRVVIVDVEGVGASCHVGYRSCFYRSISFESKNKVVLKFEEEEKLFDPEVVYEGQENPTKL